MKRKILILSTGLAMFSMFFGSGNLVYPLVTGTLSQGHPYLAFLGFFLTGVLVPFLGILGMLLYGGNSTEFFGRLGGKRMIFWFSLFALALMGPFGVLARCITVAHGAYRLIQPETPLWLFSILSCVVIFLLTVRKNNIVPLLGSILTPILLVSLGCIAYFGLSGSIDTPVLQGKGTDGFVHGIFQGYQTMDLLAAFFFSAFVITHIQNHKHGMKTISSPLSLFFKSALVGASLLSLIYWALVLLGAKYGPLLVEIPSQEMLGFIAQKTLGVWAAPLVCAAIVMACLTTAVVLTSLFADFLKKEVAHEKISSSIALGTTLAIAFAISTLEFAGIAKFIGPILDIIYPSLIVLTLFNIFYKIWGWKTIRMPIAAALSAKLLTSFL